MKKLIIFFVTALILLRPCSVYAKVITNATINQAEQVEETLHVFFDVVDETGEHVVNITQNDLNLAIGDYKAVPMLETVEESGLGIGYVFAVDISKSLSETQFEGVREAIRLCMKNMSVRDHASILTFGDEIALVSDFTSDTNELQSIIKTISPTDNNTQLYNGIISAMDIARRNGEGLPVRRVVVLLSDGIDDFPTGATIDEVAEQVEKAGIPVYVVGVEGKNNKNQLNELGTIARNSGGELYLSSKDQIYSEYEKIYYQIKNEYVASVGLNSTVANGSERGIILSVNQGGITVEDSVDVRLKAVTAPTLNTVMPTASPAPLPTAVANYTATPVITNQIKIMLIIAVAIILAALGIVAAILSMKKRKANKAERERVEEIKRRKDLDEMIDVDLAKNHSDTDGLREEENDETVFLGAASVQRLMISLEDKKSEGERVYTTQIEDAIIVGRKEGADIIIPDRSVSSRHCKFENRSGQIYLLDMNSTNGTYLLEKKEKRRVSDVGELIKNGDVMRIGETDLVITVYED